MIPLRIEGALKLILTKYGPKAESLFQDDKILPYSIAISEALEEAKPNQDVVFTQEGWYKKKTLSNNLVTSGRLFYNKNGLNIIFGSVMRKGNMSETDPLLSHGVNPDLKKTLMHQDLDIKLLKVNIHLQQYQILEFLDLRKQKEE